MPFATKRQRLAGFTLIEMLFVMAIITLLAALALPAFGTVQGKAREISCGSNLRQIGFSIAMYSQDNDGLYPYAIDPVDRVALELWDKYPEFKSQVPVLPMLHDVLQPYLKSKTVFRCPSDFGFDVVDFANVPMNAHPSAYEAFGTSYYYRTAIAANHSGETTFSAPTEINVLLDGVGQWHGTLIPLAQRYNVLFADGHVKNLDRPHVDAAWSTPLRNHKQ